MGTERLTFRDGTSSDTSDIVLVLNQAFRTPIDAATWEWYAFGNPLGPSRIYLAVDTNGRIAGLVAFAPISLRIQESVVSADFAHHLALMPAYRDTLSFVALSQHAFRAQTALGRSLAIGPPNRTAYPIQRTLMKWQDFGYLECLRKLTPTARPNRCQQIGHFSRAFDQFASEISPQLAFAVEKDHGWMNWRFCNRPHAPYTIYTVTTDERLTGYVVLKRWQDPDGYKKAHIIDVHALDSDSLSELAAAAETYADGCNEVNLWAAHNYRYGQTFAAMGYAAKPDARQPLIARPYRHQPLKYPAGACSFSYGDGDTLY